MATPFMYRYTFEGKMALTRQASDPTGKGHVLANRYKVIKKLGQGNYGVAWLCSDLRQTKAERKVIKEIRTTSKSAEDTVEDQREAALLRQLDHPAIIKFHDSFPGDNGFCIVCEYAEGGDLGGLIKKYKKDKAKFEEPQVIAWFIQILLGLQYLHDKKILHRDIKPGNLLLKSNMIKIADFGVSRRLMDTQDMATTFAGTPIYMSPELANKCTYNYKADIWATGCILYEMVTLKPAFDMKTWATFFANFSKPTKLPDWPEEYSKDLKLMFELLCTPDPKDRPSAEYILQQKFMVRQIKKLRDRMRKKLKEKSSSRSTSKEDPTEGEGDLEIICIDENSPEWKNKTPAERVKLRQLQQTYARSHEGQAWGGSDIIDSDEDDDTTLDADDITATLVQTFCQTLAAGDLNSTV